MQKITEAKILVNGKESKVFVSEYTLFVETKAGALKVTNVNVANSSLAFVAGGKEMSAKFDGDIALVSALFNCAKSDKKRSLFVFDSTQELLSKTDEGFGVPFVMCGKDAAYKYE